LLSVFNCYSVSCSSGASRVRSRTLRQSNTTLAYALHYPAAIDRRISRCYPQPPSLAVVHKDVQELQAVVQLAAVRAVQPVVPKTPRGPAPRYTPVATSGQYIKGGNWSDEPRFSGTQLGNIFEATDVDLWDQGMVNPRGETANCYPTNKAHGPVYLKVRYWLVTRVMYHPDRTNVLLKAIYTWGKRLASDKWKRVLWEGHPGFWVQLMNICKLGTTTYARSNPHLPQQFTLQIESDNPTNWLPDPHAVL
jgi:hypothetical protein